MALLLQPFSFLSPPPPSSALPPSFPIAAALSLRLLQKNYILQQRTFTEARVPASTAFRERRLVVVYASADAEGTGGPDASEPESSAEASVSIENLPLESTERLKLEQRLKMRLAKKIRLRRKRLVRKRHLRKKGRWPPSKMKKLKNV